MKKAFRMLLSLALCAALTLSLTTGALAFQDVPTDDALGKNVAILVEKGIVKGVDGGAYQPDTPITVAELVTFLGRIAGDEVSQENLPEGVTADGWSGGYVVWAKSLGLMAAAAGQYDRLTLDGVNFILSNFCALLGLEPVTASSAIRGGVTRGEAAAPLAALAQAQFDRLQNVNYTTVTEGQDWGPAITKVVLNPGVALDGKSLSADQFASYSVRTYPDTNYMTYELTEPTAHTAPQPVTAAYLSNEAGDAKADGAYVTLELAIGPELEAGAPFWYNVVSGVNDYVDTSYQIFTTEPLTRAEGTPISLAPTAASGYAGGSTLIADDFDTDGAYTYTYDGGEREIDLTYASWFPQQTAAKGSTPLVIWLHGMGEGGVDPNIAILGNKVVNLASDDIQKNFGTTGAAILAPQSPTMWLDTSGSRNMAIGTSNNESYYTEALMSLIADFVKEHPEIDTTRLYLGGCSNGGYMTIHMLLRYPGVFAAAYPVCEPYANAWLTDADIAVLAQTPMWLVAAKSDGVVPIYEGEWDQTPPFLFSIDGGENGEGVPVYEYSNALFDRLEKAGAKDVHYTLFDKVLDTTGSYQKADGTPYEYNGHWSWIYALNNECVETIGGRETSLFAWLATHSGSGKMPVLPLEKTVYDTPIQFYLIRHGKTEFNAAGIMQGWSDSPLTAEGVTLSQQLGKGLADIPFVAAYSSDSGRAVSTAKNVLAGRDVPLLLTEDLREMYFGEKEGLSSEGVYTEENIGYRFGVGFDDLGGETWEELGGRMHAALEQAAMEHRETGGNILISTHGMSVLAALLALTPDAPGVSDQGEIANCSVTILEWDNGVYTLKALDDTSYLGLK